MVNGRAWTRDEINQLVKTVEEHGCTVTLAAKLDRSHEAVVSKAQKLGLRLG